MIEWDATMAQRLAEHMAKLAGSMGQLSQAARDFQAAFAHVQATNPDLARMLGKARKTIRYNTKMSQRAKARR